MTFTYCLILLQERCREALCPLDSFAVFFWLLWSMPHYNPEGVPEWLYLFLSSLIKSKVMWLSPKVAIPSLSLLLCVFAQHWEQNSIPCCGFQFSLGNEVVNREKPRINQITCVFQKSLNFQQISKAPKTSHRSTCLISVSLYSWLRKVYPPGLMAYACNPSTGTARLGWSLQAQSHPSWAPSWGPQSESLSQN